jgi:hypothetical protein
MPPHSLVGEWNDQVRASPFPLGTDQLYTRHAPFSETEILKPTAGRFVLHAVDE